jgi:hypothetical protein
MSDEPQLRRAWLRGYRQGDVELALARGRLAREWLEHELNATKAREAAMQTEITELHRRIDNFWERERELSETLAEIRAEREHLEHNAKASADRIVAEAEQRAAALRTEGLRQVGELQQQVEQLLGLRAGLTVAMKRVTQDISHALDRLAAAPARAVEHELQPTEKLADDIGPRFGR